MTCYLIARIWKVTNTNASKYPRLQNSSATAVGKSVNKRLSALLQAQSHTRGRPVNRMVLYTYESKQRGEQIYPYFFQGLPDHTRIQYGK